MIFVLRNYGLDSATQSEEGTKAHFRMFRTVEDAARAADVRGSMISRRAGMSRGKLTKKGFMVVHISNEYPSEPVYVFDNYVRCRAIEVSLEKDGARKVKPRASDKREKRPAKVQRTSSIGKPLTTCPKLDFSSPMALWDTLGTRRSQRWTTFGDLTFGDLEGNVVVIRAGRVWRFSFSFITVPGALKSRVG